GEKVLDGTATVRSRWGSGTIAYICTQPHDLIKVAPCVAQSISTRSAQSRETADMTERPRVGLILTGGTIDSVGNDRLDLAWYIEANKRLGDGELLAQLPELKSIARVQEIPIRRLPRQALVDSEWLD